MNLSPRRQLFLIFIGLCGLLALTWPGRAITAQAQTNSGYSLRFYGHGVDDIDRAKIPVQGAAGSLPTDLGATDFTLEFWLRGSRAENRGAAITCGQNDNWIYGSVVLDRDRFSEGRKFGLSLDSGGRVVFGVTDRNLAARTICGVTNVLDGAWHHVAVQRRASDGQLWVFVDGRLDATVTGPAGDISYPDGANVTYRGPDYCQGPGGAWGGFCQNEPYLVLGAEKHDAGASTGNPAAYPSFSGWLDELRLSPVLRYAAPFTRPTASFSADADTAGLYHFDEGPAGACTGVLLDSAMVAGAPTHGVCSYGGSSVAGPVYSVESPFAPTVTPATSTPTRTPTPRATPTATPRLTPTVATPATPTPAVTTPATPAPAVTTPAATTPATATPVRTNTPAPAQNFALSFDGVDDVVTAAALDHGASLTVEFWLRPAATALEGVIVSQATDDAGWSVEVNGGRPAFWVAGRQGWQVARHTTRLAAGTWYHVAVTYNGGQTRLFVNGRPSTTTTLAAGVLAAGELRVGELPGYGRFAGLLDDLRISQNVRYSTTFAAPTVLPAADASTLGLWRFNEGRGQTALDDSAAGNTGQLGVLATQDSADPAWVNASR